MAKGKKRQPGPQASRAQSSSLEREQGEKPVTLKDMLGADTLAKLKLQAETLKQEEVRQKEAKRQEAEAAREAERKRREQDFEYLLNESSLDWKKYK
ncbi:YqkE family protein [Cohnella cellulosilytica]|uniref:YqkE family protein n=1 Tax=Cohnella cellulosilytica TaxID=986710 RepID=A0ABW2F4H3_9BACL